MKTLDEIQQYFADKHKVKHKIISVAFDNQGEPIGVIFEDKEVLPLFGKELDNFQAFLSLKDK